MVYSMIHILSVEGKTSPVLGDKGRKHLWEEKEGKEREGRKTWRPVPVESIGTMELQSRSTLNNTPEWDQESQPMPRPHSLSSSGLLPMLFSGMATRGWPPRVLSKWRMVKEEWRGGEGKAVQRDFSHVLLGLRQEKEGGECGAKKEQSFLEKKQSYALGSPPPPLWLSTSTRQSSPSESSPPPFLTPHKVSLFY